MTQQSTAGPTAGPRVNPLLNTFYKEGILTRQQLKGLAWKLLLPTGRYVTHRISELIQCCH